MPEWVLLEAEKSNEFDLHLIAVCESPTEMDSVKILLAQSGVNFQSYYNGHRDSMTKWLKNIYPDWKEDYPLTLILNKEDGKIISSLGMTDHKEVQSIVAEYKTFKE